MRGSRQSGSTIDRRGFQTLPDYAGSIHAQPKLQAFFFADLSRRVPVNPPLGAPEQKDPVR